MSIALSIDAVTKNLAENALAKRGPVTFFGGAIKLHLLFNQGATMGVGSSMPVLLSVLVILGTLAIAGWSFRSRFMLIQVFAGLAAGGSLGNFADRLFRPPGPLRGSVIDWISIFNQSAVFNLADVFIRVGLLVVVLYVIVKDTGQPRSADYPVDLSRHQVRSDNAD